MVTKCRISVPATSANLGAGFDTLGIAFELFNIFEFEILEEKELIITGIDKAFQTPDNLVYKTFCDLYQKLGAKIPGIKIHEINNIPFSRGLGSSASCIVAGLTSANLFLNNPLDLEQLLTVAARIEGHPDNVAPAIFGGITASMQIPKKVLCQRDQVSEDFEFYAFIPEFSLATSNAREILPPEYSRKDLVYSVSHALISYLGFVKGNIPFVQSGVGDKVHEPYRRKMIENFDDIVEIANDSGAIATYLSGAGPTIMAVTTTTNESFLADAEKRLHKRNLLWKLLHLKKNTSGVKIEIKR